MKKISKKSILRIVILLVTLTAVALLYISGLGKSYSNELSDYLYQNGDFQSGNVFVIGIDEHSLDELGPYQTWTRDYIAQAIETLNANPESSPAVIGVDVLYIGESFEEADKHLCDAASIKNNLVFGSYLNYDEVLVEDDGAYAIEKAVSLYEEPFDELLTHSEDGFVNGFMDHDGVVRHGVYKTSIGDGQNVYSFSYTIAKKYNEAIGNSEAIDVPVNEKGYWYIDFTDSAGGYDNNFSLSDLLQGEIPVDYFADAIVLIGPYAEGMMDSYRVAADRSADMYGVEIHANMVEAMIDGRFKQEIPSGIMCALILLIAAGAVLMTYCDKLIYSLAYSAIFVIGTPVAGILAYKKGYVADVFYIPIIVLAVMVCNVIAHYVKVLLEKRKVEGTFKRYVAPEIVNTIMEQGMDTINLGGEAVDCAILFVDIRGFTTMSEMLEPEQVVQILNRYLELTSSSIFKYDGTLDKFIGDATMAIFGAPVKLDDYIYKAVCAANNMVEKSHELAKELEAEFGRSVSFGVGVHCGKAVVGNIGTTRRMDYTAIGDTVNTAARLEANAPKDTVYISKNVADALTGRISCESVGHIPLKGKSENLEVFKLISVN